MTARSSALPDSVPLSSAEPVESARPRKKNGLKLALALFLAFLLVISDAFTTNVVSNFGDSAMRGRSPTSWGCTVQGICLVLLYAGAKALIDAGIL